MNAPIYWSIAETSAKIRDKIISPVEIAEAHLNRATQLQSQLNAFAHLDAENALFQARKAESAALRGYHLGPLHGIPITIKSCIDVAGWVCAAGSATRKTYLARHDAPLAARLKAAGAILVGNTNVPEFLMAYESDNLLYGKTSNPWDLTRTAGGSSGGEAAAIASGASMGGVGSDGGGSIRVPAHFCGICGLKPTPGRVPASGHFPPGAGAFGWIGVVGPMARTIADVRALFEVMAGPDPGDALSAPVPVRNIAANELRDVRVGILESDALRTATPETTACVQRAAQLLEQGGFSVRRFRISELEEALDLWWFFFGPVIAHLLRQSLADLDDAVSPMLREYLSSAVPAEAITADQFMAACARRDILRAEILRQMDDAPVLLSPVSTTTSFPHGAGNWRSGDANSYRETMRYSQWLNLVGFPGVSVPLGRSSEGLPIGVQVIGRPHEEELVLAVAETIEQARGPWQAPPL